MADKVDDIKKTLKILREIRTQREKVWQDIIDYVLPGLEQILIQDAAERGKRIGTNRYDGSGVSALQLFADGLYGYLVSPSIPWLRLKMSKDVMEIPEVRVWLQDIEEHFYSVFSGTNFYESMSTYFEYTPAFGFGVLYSEEDISRDKIVFHVYHPGECYIAENKYGVVDQIYRSCKIEAYKASEMFGENLSPNLKASLKTDKFKMHDFIHAVYPRKNRDDSKADSKNKPFESVWIQVGAEPQSKIVKESGYDWNPYHVWRFKKGTTPYGIGPAEDALIEIMGTSQISKSLLKAAELSVEPPYNVPSSMYGKVDVTPHGFNFYDDPQRIVSPVVTGINFPIGVDREERMQKAIERHFKVEFFTLLSQQENRAKTATEVIELQGEKAAVLGRPIGRLNTECLNPIIDRVFQIEFNAGRLPPMPDVLLEEYAGHNIEVDYMGPLAQAQKKLFQMQGYLHGLDQIGPVLQIRPEVADIIDWDETARGILQVHGFPQKAIIDKVVVEKIRQARLQAMQQESAMQELEQGVGLVKNIGEAGQAMEGLEGMIPGAAGGQV